MTTRHQHMRQALKESHLLRLAWNQLYVDGKSHEEQEFEFNHELEHPPIALNKIVSDLFEELVDNINAVTARMATEGANHHQLLSHITGSLSDTAKIMSYRLFRIGQVTSHSAPYAGLAQCPCGILFDEDADKLLSEPLSLEGEGWVINNFEPKKGEMG